MTGLDESILEFLEALGEPYGEPTIVSPRIVQRNLEERKLVEKSKSTYSRRMATLTDAGMLERLEGHGAHYRITDLGLRYVRGDLNAEELEDLLD